jgi:hypothetical protein
MTGPYRYAPLRDFLQGLKHTQEVDQISLEAVRESAVANRFIDSNDGARLAEFPVEDFVAYLLTHDQPKLTSKLGVLAKDSNSKVRALALGAAKEIKKSQQPARRIGCAWREWACFPSGMATARTGCNWLHAGTRLSLDLLVFLILIT